MEDNNQTPKGIITLYNAIDKIIEDAQNKVYRNANFTMVQAYWNIGRVIVEEDQSGQERAEYGQNVLKELSQKLAKKYGKSYGERNLRYIRQFYQIFQNWNAVRSELSWTHYRLLLKVEKTRQGCFICRKPLNVIGVQGVWKGK